MANLFSHILVGWDGSAGAVAALRSATQLAYEMGGDVVAVAVLHVGEQVEDAEERDQELAAHRQRLESGFERMLRHLGLPSPKLHLIEGRRVAKALNEYAVEHGCDLIVVGRQGEVGFRALGRVADNLLRKGSVPVLIV